jgi:hypothetical protein
MTTVGDQADGDRAVDPGAYVGHEPEAAGSTIPGGVDPADVRVSASGTQVAPTRDDSGVGDADPAASVSGRRGQAPEQYGEASPVDTPDVIQLPGPAGGERA